MRTSSDRKPETEEVPTSREMFTAETVRTASHVMIAGNALLSAHLSPLLVSSFNSIFSTLATSITYGRTPQKIQQTRLEDLKVLIENSRPLFAAEMQIFFAKSTSYSILKKQFEKLDKKYSARLESEQNIFRYLILAIGFIGLLYFVARLLQEKTNSNVFAWIETAFVISLMSLMGYSNVQSHRELVMRSRKDYQEFVQILILFNTQVVEEIPILKIVFNLEQTKNGMEECVKELRDLGVAMPEIREAGCGVEESKGAEKSLVQRVEAKLHSLIEERDKEIEELQRQKEVDLTQALTLERKEAIEQELKDAKEEQQLNYQRRSYQLIAAVENFNRTSEKYQLALEQLSQACAAFKEKVFPCQIDADSLQNLKRTFEIPEDFPSEMLEEDDLTIRFRK